MEREVKEVSSPSLPPLIRPILRGVAPVMIPITERERERGQPINRQERDREDRSESVINSIDLNESCSASAAPPLLF